MKSKIKKVIAFWASAVFLLVGTACVGEAGSSKGEAASQAKLSSSAGKWIISSNQDLAAVDLEIGKQGGKVEKKMEFVKALVANVPEQALHGLKKHFPDITIEPDIEFHIVDPAGSLSPGAKSPPTTGQPAQQVPWGIARTQARQANAINRGAGITVCVVDTGIDYTHPDLKANVRGGRNFVWAGGRVDSTKWLDDNGHGSHVSGIIAAVDNTIGTVGIAPDAKLYGVKVLNKSGSGSLSAITDGIYECMRIGAQVINMSLGATGDPKVSSVFKTAVETAALSGIAVVVAAGNEGQDIANTIPAGYPVAIAVAAMDSAGQIPSWSNFGLLGDDYLAPGVSIYSTWKTGTYNTISGTSMASPHVAGVVALHLSSNSPAVVTTDLGYPQSRQGQGLVNALGSVSP